MASSIYWFAYGIVGSLNKQPESGNILESIFIHLDLFSEGCSCLMVVGQFVSSSS
jgi:hypothetical protein